MTIMHLHHNSIRVKQVTEKETQDLSLFGIHADFEKFEHPGTEQSECISMEHINSTGFT